MALFSSKSFTNRMQILHPSIIFRYTHSITKNITKKIKLHKWEDGKDQAKPLCVILGWGSSKHRNLDRYSDIFKSRGFEIITVTPTLTDVLLFPQSRGKKISDKILETIKDEFEGRDAVILQFSNGGCGLWYFISQEICDVKSPYHNVIKVVGNVFDSCPVVPNQESVKIAQNAFAMNVKNPITRTVVWYTIGTVAPLVVWFNPIVKLFMDAMRDSPISTPQLFMYSKSDLLAPYKDISDFIEYRKNKGIETMQMLWEDSPHVSHLKHDGVTYTEILNKFLDKVNA